MTTTPKPAGLAAIDTICLLMEDFTDEQKELLVDSIHDIVDDVIDSYSLAIDSSGEIPSHAVADIHGAVSDYIVNHYGIEEFGL